MLLDAERSPPTHPSDAAAIADAVARALSTSDARAAALDALATGPSPLGLLGFGDGSTRDDEAVRASAAAQLVPSLASLCVEAPPELRRAAIAVLGRFATAPGTADGARLTARPLLVRALDDTDARVRFAALASLVSPAPPRGAVDADAALDRDALLAIPATTLTRLLASPLSSERAFAATLASRSAHADVASIAHLLDDSDGFVREAAARALGALRAAAPLVGHLHDMAPEVRVAVAESLAVTRDRTARSALESLRQDPTPSVRMAAQAALRSLAE